MLLAPIVMAAALAPASAAQPAPGSAEAAHPEHQDAGTIVVTGVRRAAGDVLGGISVLDEAELSREVRTSIGETLARQPGVSATSFGPTASAPVLRGLSGVRIRVLTDGIGSLDLASTGPDHAIAINPITAERIEVLRGPAALLFGSSAIGGVVNVIDTRIPRHRPDGPVAVDAMAEFGSAANERSGNLAVNTALGGNFVLHVDGNASKSGDLSIGGHVLSDRLRDEALASPEPSVRALAGLGGKLPNSASSANELAGGLAYVDGGLNVGVSATRHAAKYGVPIRYSLDPAVEPEAPTIDQKQTRFDARAEVPLGGVFEQVRARGGIGRYRHDEIEDTGEIGSSFFSDGGEARLELVQRHRGGWGGTSGLQYLDTDVRIRGEEKFLPDARQRQAGLFTLQTHVAGPLRLEGGARVEFSRLAAEADAQIGTAARSRSFTTLSASVGGRYQLAGNWNIGLSLTRSERAPSIEELFSNGPHGGSQAFEAGNPDLDPERSLSAELSLRKSAGPLQLTGNLFVSRFSNYIFQAPMAAMVDDLPLFVVRQGRANYSGFEVDLDARLGRVAGIDWSAEIVADAVRATIKDYGPAPFLPPLRLMASLAGSRGPFDGRLELERAFAHRRTAPVETPTDGYTLVNASLDWHPFAERPELTFSLSANNIFDVDARRSTSVLKDYAPLPGRDIRVSAQVGF